ncbi:ribosome silencing factor [Pseudomonadota bacterium]
MCNNQRNGKIPQSVQIPPKGKALLDAVEKSLDDDKAKDIVVIELSGKSDMADYLVVASGTSSRQVGAIAEHLRTNLKQIGLQSVAVEGLTQCDWVLVDGGDVVVHLFRPEVREFYNIEKMWSGDAPTAEAAPAGAH